MPRTPSKFGSDDEPPVRLRLPLGKRDEYNAIPVAAPDLDEEIEHFYVCDECGQTVDRRRLGDVLYHEEPGHKPLGPSLRFIPPMKPTLASAVPEGDQWLHEIKYDGYRTQLIIRNWEASAYTSGGYDWSDRYRPILGCALELDCSSAIIDGEMIVQDEQGRSNFAAFKAALSDHPQKLVFMAFDLLHLDGNNLRARPCLDRREKLRGLLAALDPSNRIRFSDHVQGDGAAFFEAAERMGLEGIVSKRVKSRYSSGPTRSWLKIKCFCEDEFLVIGTSRGDRAPVALLARQTDAGLEYAGAAMVTLPSPEREIFWRWNEELKTATPALPMEPRKETSWLRPEMTVRVRHLQGEEMLRHATVKEITALPRKPTRAEQEASRHSRKPPESKRFEPSYSSPAISKAALLTYYEQVAPLMLSWIRARPLNLFRCPGAECFFQRNENHPTTEAKFDPPIRKVPVLQKNGKTENYLHIDDASGLLACVQLDTVEFHGWGSRIADIEKPDRIALDLDPDEGLSFELVKDAARQLRRSLEAIGLVSYPLLTGGKGVHIVVPLTPEAEWPEVRSFAKRFCDALAEADPDRFTTALPKAQRKGRIFLDWLRNQRTATAIMPYSARARPGAPVAAPLTWNEVDVVDGAAAFSIGSVDLLLERSTRTSLQGWGEAEQTLPVF